MLRITGSRQSYAWGTTDSIPAILHRPCDDLPFAEYWLGTHPLGDAHVDGGGSLSATLTQQPELLGQATVEAFGGRLPFLMKLLSAGSPLSLQAHPSRTQAEEGYAHESLLGIPLSSPERSFKDDWPKPEAIIALEPFEGLVGFRDPLATAELFEALGLGEALSSVIGPLRDRTTTPALQEVFLDVLSLGERRHLVDEVLGAAVRHLDAPGELGIFARTAVELDEHFPGDPSILAALLLNRFVLQAGEAITLGAGVMHAYLRGTGVEVMANSDNVLRGGLTRKHIDVDALLHVVRFEPTRVRVLLPEGSDGIYCYPTTVAEFEVWLVQPTSADVIDLPRTDAGRICLVTSGSFTLSDDDGPLEMAQGQAVFVGAGEHVHVAGHGRMFMATSGA
ncbi:mannose-6-phosphate isomerase, class I [Tessaracoccus antarcticus]|uniref:mannose-6-phosphate isomerase n=1 Tax=Tessaracoccus antarcticus TaxID=2479848 RepID=A0A3M0GXI0_9ACTN|nr:mannose-6-phosphate isomerase, class I [Tessaracoccus antarcticus]RMB62076.1 mannose-6-phosphate isomerase, class I [Tessaracoccus antarcticus]